VPPVNVHRLERDSKLCLFLRVPRLADAPDMAEESWGFLLFAPPRGFARQRRANRDYAHHQFLLSLPVGKFSSVSRGCENCGKHVIDACRGPKRGVGFGWTALWITVPNCG